MTDVDAADSIAASTAIIIVLLATRIVSPTLRARRLTADVPSQQRWSSTSSRWVRRVVAAVALVIAVAALGPLLAIALAASVFVAVRSGPWRAQRLRRMEIERGFPDVVDLLIITIRAGSTPRQAVEAIADLSANPCSTAFGEVIHRTHRGQPFADSLVAITEMLGPRAAPVADAMASCERYGLALGPMLDQLSTEARASRRRLDQADARKLPVRLSFPLVVCTLPSFVLLAIAPAVIAALSSLGADAW